MTCKTCGKPSRLEFCSIRCAENSKPAKSSAAKTLDKLHIKNEQETLIRFISENTGLEFHAEYAFSPDRGWRFDFACITEMQGHMLKIAIELEGINMSGKSRHRTGTGYLGDIEKYNNALLDGWIVLRYTPNEICGYESHWVYNSAVDDLKKFLCKTIGRIHESFSNQKSLMVSPLILYNKNA